MKDLAFSLQVFRTLEHLIESFELSYDSFCCENEIEATSNACGYLVFENPEFACEQD